MPESVKNVGGGEFSAIIDSARELAVAVGPGWGLAFVIAIFLFFPRYGLLAHLAVLLKEDRADARKRGIEQTRLTAKLNSRPKELPSKAQVEDRSTAVGKGRK